MPTRAEHRRATLLALSEAAIDLFESEGPAVTVDDIAARAGMARRTVFRWVESKDDLAYIHPVLWLDVFDAGLKEAPEGPLVERLRVGSRAIALHIDDDPDPPRRAFTVIASHAELQRGFSAVFQRWVDRVAWEVLVYVGDPTDADTQFRARIIGSAVMGMVDAVMRQWVFDPDQTSFVDLYDRGFELLAPLFEGLD